MSERSSSTLDSGSTAAEPARRFANEDFAEHSRALEVASAEERIAWAFGQFGESLGMTSSFGAQSAVLLHLATQVWPEIPVVLVDTGYLFPETYRFIDDLATRLRLNLQVYRHELSPAWQEARWGKLWEQGLEGIERYNDMNKVQPMDRALAELDLRAVMAGVRRQQSSTREHFSVLGLQKGRVRLHPIVDWTDMDIGLYLTKHGLPYHPLWDEGYVSIGDWHTSRKLTDGMSAEETRFFGLKRECGLNENLDFVI
jgi:phosphoadenosine phosphosulfate reductase